MKDILDKLILVCHDSDRSNRKAAKMAVDKQRLGLVVGNASDAKMTVHVVDVAVEFCSERRI